MVFVIVGKINVGVLVGDVADGSTEVDVGVIGEELSIISPWRASKSTRTIPRSNVRVQIYPLQT